MQKGRGNKDPRDFWEYAGKIGYDNAIFANETIANHIMTKQWETVINTAKLLGIDRDSTVLELGCGDGIFTENYLALHFKHIDAYDTSSTAIKRARSCSKSQNVHYYEKDLTTYDFTANAHWNIAFCIGFFHHAKKFTPIIVSRLATACPTVVVLEPNGDNIIRKGLELLPSYRRAGEESFRLKELINIFNSYGYVTKVIKKISFVPSFLPKMLFLPFKKLENIIETNPSLNRMCSTYVLGFQWKIFK